MKLTKPQLAGVFGGLALFVAIIIVLNVVRLKNGADRGFQSEVCGPLHIESSLLPMRIVFDETARDWVAPMGEAVKSWEAATGLDLFALDLSRYNYDVSDRPGIIYISHANTDEHALGGVKWNRSTCAIGRAMFEMPGLLDRGRWVQVSAHELGHALGLDHDESVDSVMYPDTFRFLWHPVISPGDGTRVAESIRAQTP